MVAHEDRLTVVASVCLLVLWTALVLYLNLAFFRSFRVPRGWDFAQHYAASVLARDGAGKNAYEPSALAPVEEEISGFSVGLAPFYLVWNYPPSFLLLVTPLSLLPYVWSLSVWLALTFALYAAAIYKIHPEARSLWPAIASPAVFWTLLHGQNSFLFAGLLGIGLAWLRSRPLAAGLCLGIITCKPQLGMLIPVALIAGRRWEALGGFMASAGGLAVVSALAFGMDTWHAFLECLGNVMRMVEGGLAPHYKMVSTMATLLTIGVGPAAAFGIQLFTAIAMIAGVAYVWSRGLRNGAEEIVLIIAVALAAPYILVHDLTILGLALAFAWRGIAEGDEAMADRIVGILLWSLPLIGVLVAVYTGVQATALVLGGVWAWYLWPTVRKGKAAAPVEC